MVPYNKAHSLVSKMVIAIVRTVLEAPQGSYLLRETMPRSWAEPPKMISNFIKEGYTHLSPLEITPAWIPRVGHYKIFPNLAFRKSGLAKRAFFPPVPLPLGLERQITQLPFCSGTPVDCYTFRNKACMTT